MTIEERLAFYEEAWRIVNTGILDAADRFRARAITPHDLWWEIERERLRSRAHLTTNGVELDD